MDSSILSIDSISKLLCALVLGKLTIFIIRKKPFVLYQELKNFIYLHKLPGPKRYLLFGNAFETFADDVTHFNKLRQWAQEYSPVYTLIAFPTCLINFTRPEEAQKLLSSSTHSSKSFLYEFIHGFVGTGLATSNGAKWQNRRKLLNNAFHVNVLQQFVDSFHRESNKLAEEFEQRVKTGNNVIDIVPLIYKCAVKTVRETQLGVNIDHEEDKIFADALNFYVDTVHYRMKKPWLYNNFIYYNFTKGGIGEKKKIQTMNNYTKKIISNRINELKTKPFNSKDGKHMPLLDLLINAKNEGKVDWEGIQEEINTFVIGGGDTSANSLGFTLMLLANNEKYQEQIVEELNEIIPDPNEEIPLQKLNELKFLDRCLKESLRLYPSIQWITRILDEDLITSNNYTIPKGSHVGVHIYDLHRNPDVFPDPEKFDPDRFLPENVRNRHPYAYIPFSAGPRNCIGYKFGTIEIKMFLINILRKFKLEPVDTPETLAVYGGAFLRVENGIRVKFVERNK